MKKLKVGIDFDDVISDLNSIACKMYEEKHGKAISINEITSWDKAVDLFWDFYQKEEIYARQIIESGVRDFINELKSITEVFIITKPLPTMYSVRRKQIHKFFPDFDEWHIIITDDKSYYDFDYIIDDNFENLCKSQSKNKILWDKPWNTDCTRSGIVRCTNYSEIMDIIKPCVRKRVSKSEYYLDIAKVVAERSTCLKRQYGAVIVNNDEIISTGYNGSPRGEENCCNRGYCKRMNVPHNSGNYSDCHSVHAEQNAIISASRKDMINSTLYLFGTENGEVIRHIEPCPICLRMIRNAGIKMVVSPATTLEFKEEIVVDDAYDVKYRDASSLRLPPVADTKRCPKCGGYFTFNTSSSYKYCVRCGSRLEEEK